MISKLSGTNTIEEKSEKPPTTSILIACLNEENSIGPRIENIFNTTFPHDLIQVIVISDGSTDATAEIARQKNSPSKTVTVIENPEKSGRAIAHNIGVKAATGDVLVFTDAGTTFDRNFLEEITKPFAKETIGFTTGALGYRNAGDSNLTESVGLYWKFEQALRRWESDLGVNVFGTGACCAMRTSLYRDIPPTGDVDFTSPLDAALQDYTCLHIPTALAYDEMPDSRESEIKARIRMTSKNFKGTLERWGWTGVFRHPVLTVVILSHKYGRWVTPFLLLIALGTTTIQAIVSGGALWLFLLFLQAVFYFLGLLGYLRVPFPLSATIYNFLLSNFGMLLGVIKVLKGEVAASYTPIRNEEK